MEIDLKSTSLALRVSMATGKPVRVLRTSGGKWYGRPQAGIRYDGLYRVVEATIKTNSSHGGYVQFKLERIVDETNGEIDILAPSPAMVALFKQVQLGITRRRI